MTVRALRMRFAVALTTLLAVAGGCLFPLTGAAATPRLTPTAERDHAPIDLTIGAMAPAVLESGTRTTLSGTITNTTSDALNDLDLRVGLSINRYTSVSALAAALPQTQQLSSRRVETLRLRAPTSLPAGSTAAFKAVVAPHAFDSISDGVYVLQVSVRSSSSFETLGAARIALPWFDNPNSSELSEPLRLSILLPLAAPPGRTSAGTLLDDATARDFAADGRLSQLVDAASVAADRVTWVVDPALLQTAAQMSDGYSVATSDGTAGPPQSGSAAAAWLAKVRAATAGDTTRVLALTYADVDVTSLAVHGMTGDITLASTTAPELTRSLLGKPDVRPFAWPAGSTTTASTMTALHAAGVRVLTMGRSALSDVGSTASTARIDTESGSLSALLGDETLGATLSGPADQLGGSGLAQRQLFLAQTAIYAINGRSRAVVAPPLNWSADPGVIAGILSAMGNSQWVRPAPIDDVIGDTSARPARALSPMTAEARRELLSGSYLRSVRAQQGQVSLLAAVTAPAGMAADFTSGALRSESAAWRTDRAVAGRLLDLNGRQLQAQQDKIRPVASSSVTFSENGGSVPVTVANGLKVPIRVGIKLVADPGVRLIQSPPAVIEVAAATKASTEIPAQVLGAGALPVEIQLTTPDGRNFGQPAKTTLRTTAYAKAASYVVAGAFVALAATVVISSVRRRRRLVGDRPDDGAAPDD